MAFLRVKKINKNLYCYLVQNKHTKNGPRQKVKKYLGRTIRLKPKQNINFELSKEKNRSQMLKSLIAWELKKHGFKAKDNTYSNKALTYSLETHQILNKKKEVVLHLNEGFLCSFTVKRILNFKKTNDFQKDAHKLAKYFVEAGINIPQEVFIGVYEKH
jgi:hypothetical protein